MTLSYAQQTQKKLLYKQWMTQYLFVMAILLY
jgi:hypothetical protein